MVRVSTFCPRCGETIEADVGDEAKAAGRASLECPACRFSFVIAPQKRPTEARPDAGRWSGGGAPDAAAARAPPPLAPPPPATDAPRRRPRSFRPVAAGYMLLFAAVLGFWMGFTWALEPDPVTESLSVFDEESALRGVVTGPGGRPIENATVAWLADGDPNGVPARNTTTDARGAYRLEEIPVGTHLFRISKDNHTTVLLTAPVYPEQYANVGEPFGSVTMTRGDPAETVETSTVAWLNSVIRGWSWFTIAAATTATAGAIACLRRRPLWLGVTGAVAGIFTIGFVVGAVTSVVALVLVIRARREFGRKDAAQMTPS